MPPKEALDDLRDLFAAGPALEAAAVARPKQSDDTPDARVLNLADDAERFFRSVVETAVAAQAGDWTLRELDPLYKPDPGEVEWLNLADVATVEAATRRYANLGPYAQFDDGDEDYKKRLLYWVVVLSGPGGNTAFFFRSFSAAAELGRKRGAALVLRQGSFRTVSERIFLFDDNVDCFVFGGFVYVIRKRDYRRIFDQLDEVRRRARRAARDLNAQLPIANFAEFADACSRDSRMADKVLAVRQRDYFATLSYDVLKPVIDEFNLAIPSVTKDGQTQLVFSSDPDQRFRILKLVDDDYLRSSWTNHRYEVNSKTEAPAG